VIVPTLAVQVTAELYAPIPPTVATHVEVPLTARLSGVQSTATDVTVLMAMGAEPEMAGF
jgi:hypothetical protein